MANEHPHLGHSSTGNASGPGSTLTGRLVYVYLGTLCAYFAFNFADYAFGRDQNIFAVVAGAMSDGGMPYRDAWDFKPPGIFYVYALARFTFGSSDLGFRCFELCCLALAALGFAVLSTRFVGRAAAMFASTLMLFSLTRTGFWHVGQPEIFASVALVWALVLATTQASGVARWWNLVGAAALYAFASTLKPPLGGGIVVAWTAEFLLLRREGKGARDVLSMTGAFALGGALVPGLMLVHLAAKGALQDFYWALFVFTPNYTALGNPMPLWQRFFLAGLDVVKLGPAGPIGVALLLYLARGNARILRFATCALGVTAFPFLGIILQGKLFPYHYACVSTLLSLLSGWGFWLLWQKAATKPWLRVGVIATMTATLLTARGFWRGSLERVSMLTRSTAEREAYRTQIYSTGDMDRESNVLVARWLQQHAPAGSQLYVWGFEPQLYRESGMSPASRFIYNVPQRASWSAHETRRELMADLSSKRPWAIVVESGDEMPQVVGSTRDSKLELDQFDELRLFITEHYKSAFSAKRLEVFVRDGA